MSTSSDKAREGSYLALSVLSFLFNSTFLIVLWKNWTLVKRRRITYHVTNLAIVDFVFGASTFGHHLSLVLTATGEKRTTLGSAFRAIAWTACLTSLLAVCLMAIERAVCLKKPLTWKQILPRRRIVMIMIGNCVVTLSLTILLYFYPRTMKFVVLLIGCIPIFLTAALYTNIYWTTWRAKRNEATDESQQKSPADAIKERRNNEMYTKVGSFVLILTVIMIITMTPVVFTLTIISTCELFELDCKFIETAKTLEKYFYLLSIMNFIVNPIFYVWRLSLYRKLFWRMFGRADVSETGS